MNCGLLPISSEANAVSTLATASSCCVFSVEIIRFLSCILVFKHALQWLKHLTGIQLVEYLYL